MRIKALRSFCGTVSMRGKEIREVEDEIAEDLIRAGHAIQFEEDKKGVKTSKKAAAKAKAPKEETVEPEAPATTEPAPEAPATTEPVAEPAPETEDKNTNE